jgi:hypothetical protein
MACWSAPFAWSQQLRAGSLYEQGVNAYFAGRGSEAEAALSEVIQWNPQDPRAYYFRALSLLRQGRSDEARGDMHTGASLEAQAPHRYGVGAALERVQGGSRLMLEKYRRDAHRDVVVQASVTGSQLSAVVPTTFVQPEPDAAVIRERRIVPLEELLRPEGPRAIAEEPPAVAPVPTQNSAGRSAAPEKVTPAAPPAPAAGNPFEDDSANQPAVTPAPPAATPAAPAQPAPPQPAPAAKPEVAPPAEAEENPFGG